VAQEIAILRELILRINAMAEEETTLPELRRVLDTLSSASTRLVRLLQVQEDLQGDRENASALQEALAEMLKRFDPAARDSDRS
jgi:recombinational DNA repair protein RecR